MSRYLSKTVRCWRNVHSNQVLFSFLHLHWYYIIQSLFESSKPLSSDQGIVITGILHHLHGCKFCLFSFAIWEIHQTSTSMDTGFPTFSICWMLPKKGGHYFLPQKKTSPLPSATSSGETTAPLSQHPEKERKVKRKHRSKVPKPCVDLTALAKIEVGKPGKKMEKLLRDLRFMSSLNIFHDFCRRVY